MTLDVRLATVDDLPDLTDAVAEASAELWKAHGTPRADAMIVQGMDRGIRTDQAVIVARHHGKLVGWCAWVGFPGSPRGCASGLGTWVHPDYRRSSVSRQMRRMAAKKAKACGYAYVEGSVAYGNDAGLQASINAGFRPVAAVVRLDL